MKCPICQNQNFLQINVLKQRLINEWELNANEIDYINKQQGFRCSNCLCNLRSMTLADSILKFYSFQGSFQQFCNSKHATKLKGLEINSAGGLHFFLLGFKKFTFAEYPKVDIQNLPYENEVFDLVIHSDTLEHVEDSLVALKECYRVLKKGGVLFYTIPLIFERMTRKRNFLINSYHGSQEELQGDDYKVWTEYGADFWVEIFNAGFTKVSLQTLGDLSSIAISAKKEKPSIYRRNTFLSILCLYRKIGKRFKNYLN
jgi:SAM-dependent methyltransferase